MQGWMIALIAVAAVILVGALAFLIATLVSVKLLLGRRKPLAPMDKDDHSADKYGVDRAWLDRVSGVTEKRTLTAYDGIKLGARLIKHPAPYGRVAICCHGYGASWTSVQPQARMLYNRGFDVLLPCMRGHEDSEGKVGMAWIDRFDIVRWVDSVVAEYGDGVSIALFGVSMGGSAVVSVAGMDPPPQVKCVIDDCGFSSQLDEYNHNFSPLLMLFIKTGVKLLHGYSVADADITKLAATMTVPALFIHGAADDFVPCALGHKLYEACASEHKEFYFVDGAAHAMAYSADKKGYEDKLSEFVGKYIPDVSLVIDEPDEPEEAPSESAENAESAESAAEGDNAENAAAENVAESAENAQADK